jgi:hypothetical protein
MHGAYQAETHQKKFKAGQKVRWRERACPAFARASCDRMVWQSATASGAIHGQRVDRETELIKRGRGREKVLGK